MTARAALPQNYIVRSLYSHDMQTGASTSVDGATAVANYPDGGGNGAITYDKQTLLLEDTRVQSIRLATTENTNKNMDIPMASAIDMSQYDGIQLLVYVPDPASTWSIIVYLSAQGANFGKFFISSTLNGASYRAGWNTINLLRSNFTTGNSALWSQIDRIRVRLTSAVGGGDRYISILGVYLGQKERPKYALTFDDGFANMYSVVRPMLNTAGLKGTFYITKSLIDGASYMTLAQVQDLYTDGHAICNHYKDHNDNLNTIDAAVVTAGLNECADWLITNGMPDNARHMAYIGSGGFLIPTQQTYDAAKAAGMKTAVTVQNCVNYCAGEREDYLDITRVGVSQGVSTATVTDNITAVVKAGGLGCMYAHDINTTEDTANQWATSKLQTVVDTLVRLQNQGVVDVVTIPQWYNGATNPSR